MNNNISDNDNSNKCNPASLIAKLLPDSAVIFPSRSDSFELNSNAHQQRAGRLSAARVSGADLQVYKGERSPGIAGALRSKVKLSELT